ncbi:MAG: hypothetical protein H0T89_35180 [Deltaproteobacteria bacterium]|nr:hypothetical protein [Deltaproteobacteria bacterium]MDQ3299513.1 hypothetical protein [Myxococcota bacterium]
MSGARRVLFLVSVMVVTACSNAPANVVATLQETVEHVERMPRADAPWQPGRVGDTFVIGSAVRTGPASHAKLRIGRSGKLEVRPTSIVYFTRGGRARDDVKVETGSIEIEAGDDSVGLGAAVLEAHARAEVESTPNGTTINVMLGRLVLEDNIIEAGTTITLSTAGTPVVAATVPVDAGRVQPPSGVTVVIAGKPVRAKTRAGEAELAVGEHAVEAGAVLSAPLDSSVGVTRDGAAAHTAGPSVVQISDGAALVGITAGSVELAASTMDAVASVPGGRVIARAGDGAAIASVDGSETQVTAQRGSVTIETALGTQTLQSGESATVTTAGKIERLPPPPTTAVATIEAGESPVVHDVAAPTAVRVRFAALCRGAAIVEVAKDRSFKRVIARSGGNEAANVWVPAGSFSYRVRCATGKRDGGSIRVVKDSGSRPLPKTAAKTFVDLDGREYTIYYQNLLPEVTLSWRGAPRSIQYTFVVKPKTGGEKRFSSMTPKTTLRAGELREGTYAAWAELPGGRRSETGRIVIDFDNAAASASIDGVESDGPTRYVRGTVIEGTTVSVGGAALELDRHRRFTAEVSTELQAVAVRIAHPKTGVHYYVVRDAGR